ncbi:hypothetical protein [Flavobacterium caseinilyticum]|uniref:Uncharacterized protein n=1 Tax=Flavobacterium caseinilyticum TaxID=2541732 RepID=A0A4R5APR7_9FLAO|nr:hypothetical protein [Flavobacterium caseinilyticum]TDD74145.1 hypothetical protein E0F89_15535 [Flavobacterium caseinilyticum]
MKKYIFYLMTFEFLILNVRCSSDVNLDANFDHNIVESVTVKEYKTNIPLPEVKFSIYFCKKYDVEFGTCIEKEQLSSCVTDKNGICKCTFPKNSFADIIIEKPMYWIKHYHNIERSKEYVIQPEAWVNINFIANAEYPSTCTFFIKIDGELRYAQEIFQLINPSNKVLTLFGNEENKINWILYKTFNSNSEVLNSGSFILNPKKFKNLTYTLNY